MMMIIHCTKNAKLRIWSHLLKKSIMQNFIFCVVNDDEPRGRHRYFFKIFISHFTTPNSDLDLYQMVITVFVLGLSQKPTDSSVMPKATDALTFLVNKTKAEKSSCKNSNKFHDEYVEFYFDKVVFQKSRVWKKNLCGFEVVARISNETRNLLHSRQTCTCSSQ